jgi:hypothetical protein
MIRKLVETIEPDYNEVINSVRDQVDSLREIYNIHMIRIDKSNDNYKLRFYISLSEDKISSFTAGFIDGSPDIRIDSSDDLTSEDVARINDMSKFLNDAMSNS